MGGKERWVGVPDSPIKLENHSARHENSGDDEINVGGLSGDLADLQDPKDHTHQSAGSGVGGQLDHGLAITSASLLDDDHPGYRQKHGIQTIGALTFADATHILTVATGITYWFNGVEKVISGSTTCDIDTYETLTDNTLYWFYFDDASGTLKCSDDLPDFKANAYVATVFWNGTNGAIGSEHHSYLRNTNWHVWAHYTVGLRYESGLTLTSPTTDADDALQIESGIIWDEDLESVISQQTTSCRIVYKASASVYTWVASALPYAGSGVQPQYLDTDNYTLTNVGASDFACMWVYATNDIDRPIYIIPTHAATAHNIIALARAEVQPVLAALNLSPEVKLIYRFIYKGNGEFQESNDYRLTQALPSGGVATVNAGSVAFIPSGNIAATTVQTAIEELDTEKVAHALATAEDDFLVASGANTFAKQTLAETLTTLGKAAASGLASLNAASKVLQQPASITDHLDGSPDEDDATKAPTSEWAFDHAAAADPHPNLTAANLVEHSADQHTLGGFLDKFREFIDWSSLDGYTIGGDTGYSVAPLGATVRFTTGVTTNYDAFFYGGTWLELLDVGKIITVEFIVNQLTSVANLNFWIRLARTGSDDPPSETVDHFGFKLMNASLYASNANGTSQAITDTTVNLGTGHQRRRLRAVLNPGTDCKFYVDDVLKVTHDTYLPDIAYFVLNVQLRTLENASKLADLGRVFIEKEHA